MRCLLIRDNYKYEDEDLELIEESNNSILRNIKIDTLNKSFYLCQENYEENPCFEYCRILDIISKKEFPQKIPFQENVKIISFPENTAESHFEKLDYFTLHGNPEYYKEDFDFKNLNDQTSSTIQDISGMSYPSSLDAAHCVLTPKKVKKLKPFEEIVFDKLTEFSKRLRTVKIYQNKIPILMELDDFLKEHKDLIKKRFPDKLVGILNSL